MQLILVLTFSISLLALALAGEASLACSCKSKCDKEAQKAKAACEAAAKGAEAAGQAHNAAGTAQDAAHGGQNNRGTGNLCPRLNNQKNNLDNAKSQCEQAKKHCQLECSSLQNQHQTQRHSGTGPDPGVCEEQTKSPIAQMTAAAAPLAAQAAEACKSGNEAKDGGQPPQPPQPPQKEDKPEEKKEETKQAGLNCDGTEGARYSDCNDKFIQKCGSDMNQSGCDTFGARYCGTAGGAPDGTAVDAGSATGSGNDRFAIQPGSALKPAFANNNTSGLVVDKRGEGLGTSFCRTYQAYKFCQQTGRAHCPSCTNLNASMSETCMRNPQLCMDQNSPQQVERAKSDCPSDPIFSDPTKQIGASKISTQSAPQETTDSAAKVATGAGSALGSASGGGGSGLSSASTDATLETGYANGGAMSEGPAQGINVGIQGGGGGGGGGFTLESSTDSEQDPQSAAGTDNRLPAQNSLSLPSDVANTQSETLFAISSRTYQKLCKEIRLKCR